MFRTVTVDGRQKENDFSAPVLPESMSLGPVEALNGLSPGPGQDTYAAKFRSPCAPSVVEESVLGEASPLWNKDCQFFPPGDGSIRTASSLGWGEGRRAEEGADRNIGVCGERQHKDGKKDGEIEERRNEIQECRNNVEEIDESGEDKKDKGEKKEEEEEDMEKENEKEEENGERQVRITGEAREKEKEEEGEICGHGNYDALGREEVDRADHEVVTANNLQSSLQSRGPVTR